MAPGKPVCYPRGARGGVIGLTTQGRSCSHIPVTRMQGETSGTLAIEMGKYRRVESKHFSTVTSVCSARADPVLPV